MAISTDSVVQELKNKIQFKNEELSFFASKIIAQDSASDATTQVITSIDTDLLDEVESVNNKLRDLQSAYQDRVDEGCKSDLFWRIIGKQDVYSSEGQFSYSKFTLKCTKLSQSYEKIFFGSTSYTDSQLALSRALRTSLAPLDDGMTVYYVSTNTSPVYIPGTSVGITTTVQVGVAGISNFRSDETPTYATLSDNLYGIKYYDEPYAKDIGDTFVCSFPGKISVGSSILTALTDGVYGGADGLEIGQIITSSKNGVFAAGYNTIVGIATTLGNTDPTNPTSPAFASAGITTSYRLSGITISNGGTGFTTTPSVTISAPNAITAIGTAVVSGMGSITSVNITNPGTGYTQAPLVYFSTPGSYAATGIGSTGALGIVTSVIVNGVGYGYTVAPTITFANPQTIGVGIGSTALGVAFISTSAGGIVTGVAVTFPGFGYTTSPAVTFSSPGIHTAVGIATLGIGASVGIVTGIIVGTGLTNTGFGYTTSTSITVTIADPEKTTAVGVANVSSASTIASITLSNVGAGYTSAPTVTISDPALQTITLVTLQNVAIGSAFAPESDGSLVSFTASLSSTGIASLLGAKPEDLSVSFDKGTFSPQTVGIMTYGTVGIGVSIKYDNSGQNAGTESWKPEYAHSKISIPGGKDIPAIEEPKVGAGKIFYTDGLDFYPIKTPGDSNSKAVEGETIEVNVSPIPSYFGGTTYTSLASFVQACPSCSGTVTTNLNNATSAANSAKSAISSGVATLNVKVNASNQFRKQRGDNQLQIWGYRTVIGQLLQDKQQYESTLQLFENPTITGIFT